MTKKNQSEKLPVNFIKNFAVRFLSFLILAPLLLFVVFYRGAVFLDYFYLFYLFSVFVALFSSIEYMRLFKTKDVYSNSGFVYVAVIMLNIITIGAVDVKLPHAQTVYGINFFSFSVFIILIVSLLFFLKKISEQNLKGMFFHLGAVGSAVFLIGFFCSFLTLIYRLPSGSEYIFYLLAMSWLYDTGGLVFGKKFGYKLLCARISPKKTYEGLWGGILTAVVSSFVFYVFSRDTFSFAEIMILPVFISILSQAGDLMESAFKRIGQIKDSGTLIPGHGGIYDIFDGVIFTAPFFYFYLIVR